MMYWSFSLFFDSFTTGEISATSSGEVCEYDTYPKHVKRLLQYVKCLQIVL
jgi:hypothetical protein